MKKIEKINVGLIGFGTIGTGVVRVLSENSAVIKRRLGVEVVLRRVADRDTKTDRGVKLPDGVLTDSADDVINDPEIDIVIELVGGTTVAKDFVLGAIHKGKHVVTANKALISTFGGEIFEKADSKGVSVGFEASVGGGIPIIKAMKEGLAANNIESLYGIINGTANYILTKMTDCGGEFSEVLKEAQDKGYAEADPTYDVEGIDTAHKLAILINLAYGTSITHSDIFTEGISTITDVDVEFAREFGYRIKLLAIAKESGGEIEARVHPTMVPASHPIAKVDGVFNAVFVHGDAVDDTMFYGMGAGMMPTASAVVADVMDISRDMVAGSVGRIGPLGYSRDSGERGFKIKSMDELRMPYYLRFAAFDRPGVLSKISGVLGAHNISIESVIQKGRKAGEAVPLVITTHDARESELGAAIEEIRALDVIETKEGEGGVTVIRIEETLGGVK